MSETNDVEFVVVNKFSVDPAWKGEFLFGDTHNVRATMRRISDLIGLMDRMGRIERRLNRELGDDTLWFIDSENLELYLNNSAILMMWKIQNPDQFNEWFDKVEQHSSD